MANNKSKKKSVRFFDELKNFRGNDATITLLNGYIIHAKIVAIEFNDLNFIIEHSDGIKEMINGDAIQSVRLGIHIEK